MALQDRTLANTAAKMSMEAKRRRNTETALAAMRQGTQPVQSASEMALRGLGGLLLGPRGGRPMGPQLESTPEPVTPQGAREAPSWFGQSLQFIAAQMLRALAERKRNEGRAPSWQMPHPMPATQGERDILGMLPVAGDVEDVRYLAEGVKEGDPAKMLMGGAAAALPFVPIGGVTKLKSIWEDADFLGSRSEDQLFHALKSFQDDTRRMAQGTPEFAEARAGKWGIWHELERRGIDPRQREREVSQRAQTMVPSSDYDRPLIAKARRYFGTTALPSGAGYILPDGKMLDLSGANQGGTSGERALDHREVAGLDDSLPGGTEGMNEFMRRSNAVRFSMIGDEVIADLNFIPHETQLRKLVRYARQGGGIVLDVTHPRTGDTLGTIEESKPTIEKLKTQVRELLASAR